MSKVTRPLYGRSVVSVGGIITSTMRFNTLLRDAAIALIKQ